MNNIVIATIKEWNIKNYFSLLNTYQDTYIFHLITHQEELDYPSIKDIDPLYIFFPHWSWKVPENIYKDFTCIVFHMTDLPFGRGGSPLQNLIMREVYDTKISAIAVVDELDAGDIYLQQEFDISSGSAQDNFIGLSAIIFEIMIPELLQNRPKPWRQEGEVTTFQRRVPKESDIKTLSTLTINKLYDFIRMLDGEGYPKAFLQIDELKIEFSDIEIEDDRLTGRFEVMKDA